MDQSKLLRLWKESMEQFVIHDIKASLQKDVLEVGLIILTLIGIDSLSGYYVGEKASTQTFKKFIQTSYFPKSYHHLADDIYVLRNRLVHDYTSTRDKIVLFRTEEQAHDQGLRHLHPLRLTEKYPICFVRETFAKDFLEAWSRFSNDVTTDDKLANNVVSRVKKVGREFLVVKEIEAEPRTNESTHSGRNYTGGTIPYKI